MSRRSSTVRALVALPIVLLMGLALLAPGTAAAAEGTSGYTQTPTTPSTPAAPPTTTTTPTTPTTTTPTTGTSPEKSEEKPAATSTAPKETTPTASSSPANETAKTLPFTGFDLRWSFGIGLILMGAGFSIVMLQRRRREGDR